MIRFNNEYALDCCDTRFANLCMASLANSNIGLVHKKNKRHVRPNAVLVVNSVHKTAHLKAIEKIPAGKEILFDYGYDPLCYL